MERVLGIDAIQARRKEFIAAAISKMGTAKGLNFELRRRGFRYEDGTISSWKGAKVPPGDVMLAISDITGLSLDEYLSGKALEQKFADILREQAISLHALQVQVSRLLKHTGLDRPQADEVAAGGA
jgi:hypothetical protein